MGKEKSVLAICNTPLQIICALNLKNTIFKDAKVEIIISDHIKNGKKLVDNSNKYQIFSRAYYVESFSFCRGEISIPRQSFRNKINYRKKSKELFKKFVSVKDRYDTVLLNNIDCFGTLAFSQLWKRNRNIKAYLIEDGYSSYYAQGWEFLQCYQKEQSVSRRIKNFFYGEKSLVLSIQGQYLYNPDDVQWEAPFERIQIPKINLDDIGLRNRMNRLFGYENMQDVYDKPVIFFEESFRKEGIDIGDVQLVETIAEIIGRDNIMIKRHPRNDDDVFEKLGYKINKNTEIPWEVIVMNNTDLTEKVGITICSGAAATPFTMFGMNITSVILLDWVNKEMEKKFNEYQKNFYERYFLYMNEKIFNRHPEIFYKPRDLEDLKNYFIQWKRDNGGKLQ